jgi:hypothetical protein
MKKLLLMMLLSLSGCQPSAGDEDPCAAEMGYLEVCATLFDEPATGGAVIREGSTDAEPIEALFDSTGCTTVRLDGGEYEWAAESSSANCFSDFEEVSVSSCGETTSVTVELQNWCLIGG